ncbi:1-pyrroline-5-carboxylate dehydrogenase [Trichodelitschia bisporula]|uniref:Multifunctional fusion protein n=1 Tax=Trichodelitschia bisporula TaxID=703511 RepID=A0A6G1HZS6_9PEZI|nr:1-pyrroline-5-carboxylate dehydrogenase [Trichodelitschia bisporula]
MRVPTSTRRLAGLRLIPRARPLHYRPIATLATFKTPSVTNEPNQTYARDHPSRAALTSAVDDFSSSLPLHIPLRLPDASPDPSPQIQRNPSNHAQIVAKADSASTADVNRAISRALAAKETWSHTPFADRAAIFLRAAALIAGPYRARLLAATMLGQGKSAWQAEIDAAAELADFLRFNVTYAETLYSQQPTHHSAGVWNRLEYRPLEGFVYAVSPFNFTAIGGNLVAAPALMGNVVVWKPSPHALAANMVVADVFAEAGLPEGVMCFLPGDAGTVTKAVLAHRQFAALHFTGSTAVFRSLYGEIGRGVAEGRYAGYPRLVGETGGKNFHLLHSSAELRNAVVQTVRGAFEFQGQKCSATSRVYCPASTWEDFKKGLVEETEGLKVGSPREWGAFVGPLVHKEAFERVKGVIEEAKGDSELELLAGGTYDGSTGYFVRPTIYRTTNPEHPLLSREIFGPVLAVYVYDDSTPDAWSEICKTIDGTSEYALTGAVFASDRSAIREAEERLRDAAGNFYVNCKSTGAVVGQQPFGGGRASGTNDKAGSINLLGRFVSVRAIKEEFVGTYEVGYPSNE